MGYSLLYYVVNVEGVEYSYGVETPLIELKYVFVCSLFEWCMVIRGLSYNSLVEFMECLNL